MTEDAVVWRLDGLDDLRPRWRLPTAVVSHLRTPGWSQEASVPLHLGLSTWTAWGSVRYGSWPLSECVIRERKQSRDYNAFYELLSEVTHWISRIKSLSPGHAQGRWLTRHFLRGGFQTIWGYVLGLSHVKGKCVTAAAQRTEVGKGSMRLCLTLGVKRYNIMWRQTVIS